MADPGTSEASSLRLFFALRPDDATRDALNRTGEWLHQHWGGRRMRADTFHITLAFLGQTSLEKLDALVACADGVQGDSYELLLDQAGYWRKKRIGWLGASGVPPQHMGLVQALGAALQQRGFLVDARPHVPHVTLLRNTTGGDGLVCAPILWKVSAFALLKSATRSEGAHYEVVRNWALGKMA